MRNLVRRFGRTEKLFALFTSTVALSLFLVACATDEQKATSLINNTSAAVTGEKTVHGKINGKEADQDYSALFALNQPTPSVDLAKRFITDNLSLEGNPATQVATLQQQVLDLMAAKASAEIAQIKSEAENAQLKKQVADADAKEAAALKAEGTAFIADAKKGDQLNSYNDWFGLSGLFHFAGKSAMALIIGLVVVAVIFIGLDFASSGSPIAKVALTAAENVVAVPLKFIEAIIPGAISAAGWVVQKAESEFVSVTATAAPPAPSSTTATTTAPKGS
jgi:hypothetical protein